MEAFEHQSACVACVVKLLQNQKEVNWGLPVMYTVCLDLRLVAQKAEATYRMYSSNKQYVTIIIVNSFAMLCLGHVGRGK